LKGFSLEQHVSKTLRQHQNENSSHFLPNFEETKEQEGSKGSCRDGDISERFPYLELNMSDKEKSNEVKTKKIVRTGRRKR